MGRTKASDNIPKAIREYIDATAEATSEANYRRGMEAQKKLSKQMRTPYQNTEARLYSVTFLTQKIKDDCEYLSELKVTQRMPEHSRDLPRFSKGGTRISPEEKLEELIKSLYASIDADKHTIEVIRKAVMLVEDDPFYPAIQAKYFGQADDDEIAEKLYCDERTIRRHRSRIISQLSVRFYGSEAIQ